MKPVVLIWVLLLGYGASPLRANRVVTLGDSPEVIGKLTLTPASIRVELGSSPTEINLSTILEAGFGETLFQLDCYFSNGSAGTQLPPAWKAQDIGVIGSPGSVVAAADGTFTLSGGGLPLQWRRLRISESLYFVGQPWTGDGQWTARVTEIEAQRPDVKGGLMLRDTLDPNSAMFRLGATIQGNGGIAFRADAGNPTQGTSISMDVPVWLRLTRYGANVFGAISSDGKTWDLVGQDTLKTLGSPWIGFFADNYRDSGWSKVVLDQVSFTPPPSLAQVLPPGVLLQSGSFLAGTVERLDFDPADPDASGNFVRNGKYLAIPRSKIAAVLMLPTARSQIADMGSHIGVLMKNGDVMDGDFNSINREGVLISSVLLGPTTYGRSDVRACFLHPRQAQPARYEIRLRDGSIVNANGIDVKNGEVLIEEASGVIVEAAMDEVAQFRAGTSQVQSLAELDWKATPPPAAPVVNAVPSTHASPATNAAPVANAIAELVPEVQGWEGKNQEQIMVAPVGTIVDFPLTDKFRAMAMRIAVSPDSPPNASATIRVLADGREVGRTLPFKAGDQPRFMEVTLQDPKTVTLVADSIFAGAKVLYIDPVAIRDR